MSPKTGSAARRVALLALSATASFALHAAPLAVAPAQRLAAAGMYETDATLQARLQVDVAAQVPGRVLRMHVKPGDSVKAGQLIAQLDDREQNASESASLANVAEAQAQLAKAEYDLKRSHALAQAHFVSPSAVEQAETQVQALRARVTALQATAGVASTGRSHTRIVAPFEGLVAATYVEAGDLALPGKAIATLYQPGQLRAVAHIPEQRLATLREALARQASAEVLLGGQGIAPSRITVVPTADPATRTTEVRLDLPAQPPGGTPWLPGQYARVRFAVGEANRLVIPQAAVLRRSELTAVYVQLEGDRYQQRQVRLGERLAGDQVEVLAGLKAGERVALDPLAASLSSR